MSWCCCPDTRPGDRFLREISDLRFEIPAEHKGRNIEGKQNSKRAEHISRLYHRFLRDPDFRFQIPKLARFLISDFRLRISDPRTPATPRQRFRFQKTDFKGAGPDPTGFRFQISDPSAEQADVASPLQISDFRIFRPPECHPGMVCQNSRCQISESRIQIPGAKKSVRVP